MADADVKPCETGSASIDLTETNDKLQEILDKVCEIRDQGINIGTVEVDPSQAWQDLFEAAIDNALTSQLQGILEAADLTVNAIQSGTWTVDIGSMPDVVIDAQSIADLKAAVQMAIEQADFPELEVTLNGEEVTVNGTVALDPATLAALEDITVSGTVDLSQATIDAIVAAIGSGSGTVTIDPQTIADLVAALEAADLNVTVTGGNITVDGEVTLDPTTIQAIADAIAAQTLTVQGTVSVDSLPSVVLDAQSIADLVAAIEAGGPYQVVVTGGTMTVTLDQASLDALENITVTVDTSSGPIDITGAVTIDQSGGPLQVEVTNFPSGFDINNTQDLATALAAALDGLNVNIGTGPFAVTLDQATIDAIADQDDTDDDVRPVTVQCFCWTAPDASTGTFEGYAKADELGTFVGWEVITGTPPPTGSTIECRDVKLLDQLVNCECPPDGSADLEIQKITNFNNVNEGDQVQYLITVTNHGPDPATGVIATEQIPAGTTFVSSDQGPAYDPVTGQWNVGSLAVGQAVTMFFTVQVDQGTAGQVIANSASVSGDQSDPTSTNNTDSAQFSVNGGFSADSQVTKTVDNPNPGEGEQVTFTVTYTNNGPDTAESVVVTDLLPAGLTFVSANPSIGNYNQTNGQWSVGDVVNGDSETLTLVATVDGGTQGSTLTNTAMVTSTTADTDAGNNSASVDVTPIAQLCYEVCSTPTPGPNPGTYIQRTGTGVSNPDNAGDAAAPGGPFFNQPDADGIPSIDPGQAFAVATVGPGASGGHFNDPSGGTTNDWHESTGYLAIPPSACLEGVANILISGHNFGDAHQSTWAAAGWDRSALQEIGRYSEDSFAQSGSLPIRPFDDSGNANPFWTGPAPQDGTLSIPLSNNITSATVHVNSVDERQQSDVWWQYSLDGGATWIEVPQSWFYSSPADAAQATPNSVEYSCVGGVCTPDNGGPTQTEAQVQAAGGVAVTC